MSVSPILSDAPDPLLTLSRLAVDTERAGTFEPLRFLPQPSNKTVILGLLSSKVPQLEDKAAIIARIKEASQYVPLEQLGLSCQCGYSSTSHGNAISEEYALPSLERPNIQAEKNHRPGTNGPSNAWSRRSQRKSGDESMAWKYTGLV